MKYVTCAQGSRELDRLLIDKVGIPGVVLMEEAALAVAQKLKDADSVLILCGTGNNGGDGFALLRILAMRGQTANAVLIGDPEKIKGDAKINYDIAQNMKLPICVVSDINGFNACLHKMRYSHIADALFGTGISRDITGLYADVINAVNSYDAVKVAIDMPSGVSSDDGKICSVCIRADETVTFQTPKRGLLLYPGHEAAGKITVAPIAPEYGEAAEFVLEKDDIKELLPKRRKNSHKGTYGKLLIIAACDKYAGAGILSTRSALKSGAGMIRLVSEKRASNAVLCVMPEIMTHDSNSFSDLDLATLKEYIAWCDAIAIGMGLGTDNTDDIIRTVLSSGKSVLLDADALNRISEDDTLMSMLNANCIITPHPGELSRLMKCRADDIIKNPVYYAVEFAREHGVNVLLKGATSIIADPQGRVCYNLRGSSALAKGGSGDMLSGVISSLMVQGLTPFDAACVGAYINGCAAEEISCPERCSESKDITDALGYVFEDLDS